MVYNNKAYNKHGVVCELLIKLLITEQLKTLRKLDWLIAVAMIAWHNIG